ncbi:MAG: hypothetical protein GY816_09975 [Cytophagales bacterium]|nr:hypothetical protein [Cytophagales bacterium]
MKKQILLITAIFSAAVLFADDKIGETRTAKHTVSISGTTEIRILGKYTYLQIETWDKNEVSIEASVIFNGKMVDRVQKFLDEFEQNVKEGVTKNGNELEINTRLKEPNRVQIGSKNVGVHIGYSDKELNIEYIIKVPTSNKLIIKGAYEDIDMSGTYDDVEITQYSADLTAEKFNKAKLNLKYGDAEIDYIMQGEMETYEQEVEIEEIEFLNLNTKYSDLNLDQVQKLTVLGYETDFSINDIQLLKGNLKYGTMEIESKLAQGTLTLYEFDIDAQAIGNLTFENSKYCDFEIDKANEIRFIESYEDELNIRYLNTLITKSKYGEYEIEQLGNKLELNGYEDNVTINDVMDKASRLDMDGKYLKLDINLTGTSYSLATDLKYGKVNYNESEVDVRKYIKENSTLKIELNSKSGGEDGFQMNIRGYEVDVNLE